MKHFDALPDGYEFDDYEIIETIGRGNFGITYLALDVSLSTQVAIKEFFPADLVRRDETLVVRARSEAEITDFETGLSDFLEEARTLASVGHQKNVVRILRFFQHRGTGYIVMEFVPGCELTDEIHEHNGRIETERLYELFVGLMNGLEKVHSSGYLHRDLKPSNIRVNTDGQPVIIDFGTARQNVSAKSRPMTAILTVGYAPIEQYSSNDEQNFYTDIYALGAVAYCALRGAPPPEATLRRKQDPYQPLAPHAIGELEETLFSIIDWSLKPDEEDRPQSIAELREALSAGARAIPAPEVIESPDALIQSPTVKSPDLSDQGANETASQPSGKPANPQRKSYPFLIGIGAVAAVIAVAYGGSLLMSQSNETLSLEPGEWTEVSLGASSDKAPIALSADGAFWVRGRKSGPALLLNKKRSGLPEAIIMAADQEGVEMKPAGPDAKSVNVEIIRSK